MSSSPYAATSPRDATLLKESPSRYHDRFNERFKSLSNTPPRENISVSYTGKSSPLKPSTSHTELPPVESKPVYNESVPTPPPQPKNTPKSIVSPGQPTKEEIKEPKLKEIDIPTYMQATHSSYIKSHSKKETHKADNILRPRFQGGITKRVGTSKIPRYQSTTTINAIEEIKNEMAPEDVYIPLAARIKLFEKGLGNGSNKPPSPVVSKYSSTPSTIKSESPAASPKPTSRRPTESLSRSRSSISSVSSSSVQVTAPQQRLSSISSSSSSVPHYAQQTTQSMRRQKDIQKTKQQKTEALPVRTISSKEAKPFHFATKDRAKHYEAFKQKLDLWKHKDKQATIENQKTFSINLNRKRKRDDHDCPPEPKHARQK